MPAQPDHLPGDEVLAADWIWITGLRGFLELVSSYVGYRFDDLDWDAVGAGLGALTGEDDTFGYPIGGRPELGLVLARYPGGDEVRFWITGRRDRLLSARICGLTDAFQLPR